MKTKTRLFALLGVLGFVALTGAGSAAQIPIETFCMCACPDGTVVCVGSGPNGDCSVPCAQAVQRLCPSDS